MSEFLSRSITISTTKASVLNAKADQLEKKGEANIFDAWCLRYEAMIVSGQSVQQYAKTYRNDTKRITDYSADTIEKYLGAVKRAVKKYGSTDKAKQAYLNETKRLYIEFRLFVAWCPAGQRAKSADKKVAPALAVTLTRAEGVKRLVAGGVSRKDANIYATLLGLK